MVNKIKPGDIYGKLTVLSETDERRDGRIVYMCKCECGNIKKIQSKYVKRGKGCGYCGLALDDDGKAHNKYDLTKEYGVGYTSNGEEFYFDKEDYDVLYPYCWYKSNNGYICSKNEKIILMHRFVLNPEDDYIIDHINHNKHDNRKSNLRICTYGENGQNKIVSKGSNTGLKYIVWNKQISKYQIHINGEYYGSYINIATAKNALDEIIKNNDNEFIFEKSIGKNDLRKILYIDLDCVIFDTIQTIVNLYNDDYSNYDGFEWINYKDVRSWDFKECSCASAEMIDMYFLQKRFFDNLFYIDGAIETLNKLKNKYLICFVSSGRKPNLLQKEIWKNRNFPYCKFIGVDLDIYKDKSHVDMSDGIFIDDLSLNLKTSNAYLKILFGQSFDWNAEWNGIRCQTWDEVLDVINDLENRGEISFR